jgi:hypothetical protein
LINRLLGEEFFALDAEDIVTRSRSLENEEAYALLHDWVLPSQDHSTPRIYYHLAPRLSGADESPSQIVCPAIELMDVAQSVGQLEQLVAEVEKLKTTAQLGERSKMALLALAAMKQQDDTKALEWFTKLYEIVEKGLPTSLPARNRAPEYVVAWQAIGRPALRVAAHDMAIALRDAERKKTSSDEFRKHVAALVGHAEVALAQNRREPQPTLAQWQVVPYEKPASRAKGHRPSTWDFRRGVLHHVPGETWGQLFFQSPLRGKFEIVLERTTHGHQEILAAYGMHAAEPYYNLTSTRVFKVMHNAKNVGGELKIPRWNDKLADYRIVVDGGKITTYTNEIKIHEEILNPAPDPWLVLQSNTPGQRGTIRNLRILGTPEILEEIHLIDIAGWASWRADIFGEWFSTTGGENSPWRKVGEEIQGQLRKDRSATPYQSLLMYQRPLLEDGEIEFESYHVPDEFAVHPAIGRSAFLIRPDGVFLHQLTNAPWDPADALLPDNETKVGDVETVALKENDWNHFVLKVVKDEVTIRVNGTVVLRAALKEPINERFFGLFRYSDTQKCRVRNVVYRGDWPKTLPPLEQQELAYPAGGPYQSSEDTFAHTVHLPLDRPLGELKKQGFSVLGSADMMNAEENGTRIRLQNADGFGTWTGLSYDQRIAGDFEATVGFEQLEMVPLKEGWGMGFGMTLVLSDPTKTSVEVGVFVDANGRRFVKAMRRHLTPSGNYRSEFVHLSIPYETGQLRIVRQSGAMACLIAGDDGEFRFLRAFAVGEADVTRFRIQNKCSDAVGEIDVLARDFRLRH